MRCKDSGSSFYMYTGKTRFILTRQKFCTLSNYKEKNIRSFLPSEQRKCRTQKRVFYLTNKSCLYFTLSRLQRHQYLYLCGLSLVTSVGPVLDVVETAIFVRSVTGVSRTVRIFVSVAFCSQKSLAFFQHQMEDIRPHLGECS